MVVSIIQGWQWYIWLIPVPSQPTNLMLEQNDMTSINASWSPPPQSANITGYRVFWTRCASSDCINHTVINSTVETLTGLMAGQCYSVYVVSVSDLPSDTATRNITLGNFFLVARRFCLTKLYLLFFKVTNPGNISIDVVSTYSHGFSLMINLSNYVENGIYRIMTNVTWLRFLHCNNGLGSSNITNQTYDVNPMNLSITGLVPNSEYNITVVVSNAAGSRHECVSDETWEAGTVINPYEANFYTC